MMRLAVIAPVLVAALAASGCASAGHANSPAASHASSRAASAAAAAPSTKPPTCRQQYEKWKNGPAKAKVPALTSALKNVQTQASNEDLPGLSKALEAAGRAAQALASQSPPHCADPKGYFVTLLDRIKAAGDNAGTSRGLSALLLAEAPLKSIPGLEKKLSAELDKTVGKNH